LPEEPTVEKIVSNTQFGFHISKDVDLEMNLNVPKDAIITINLSEDTSEESKKMEIEEPISKEKPTMDLEAAPSNTLNQEPRPEVKEPDFSIDYQPIDTNIKKDVFNQANNSPFYVMNLVFFEKQQGIIALLQMIHLSRSASQIISILDFIENLWNFFEKEFLLASFSQVLEDIKMIPQKINEDEIKNSKKTEISELLHTIEVLLYLNFFN